MQFLSGFLGLYWTLQRLCYLWCLQSSRLCSPQVLCLSCKMWMTRKTNSFFKECVHSHKWNSSPFGSSCDPGEGEEGEGRSYRTFHTREPVLFLPHLLLCRPRAASPPGEPADPCVTSSQSWKCGAGVKPEGLLRQRGSVIPFLHMEVGHELAMRACSPESQSYPDWGYNIWVQGGDPPFTPLSGDPTQSTVGFPVWATHGPLRAGPEEGREDGWGWSAFPMRKGWESWGCSAWRREGSGDTLL